MDRRTGGPHLGLDPDGKRGIWVMPGMGLQKDNLGRYFVGY